MENLKQNHQTNLKAFIDNRIQEYTEHTQKLTSKYLQDKQRHEKKIDKSKLVGDEIKNTIKILNQVLQFPAHLRQQITNVNGMTTQDISGRISELERLLTQYQAANWEKQTNQQDKNQVVLNSNHQVISESFKQLNEIQSLTSMHQPAERNKMGVCLVLLEGGSYICALIAIIIFIYNLTIK